MTDAATRAVLREHVAWGIRPGARVVMQDSVRAAGHDVDRITDFITSRGGSSIEPPQTESVEPGRRPYWLVTRELLAI